MNTDFLSAYQILAADGTELTAAENAETATTTTAQESAGTEVGPMETVILGVGTVFVGLIAIIIICRIMGFFCELGSKNASENPEKSAPVAAPVAQSAQKSVDSTIDRGELAAAISAAIAEYTGTDAAGIKIVSIKKV